MSVQGPSESHATLLGNVGRREAIDWVNDPTRFGVALEKRIDRLALNGAAKQRPWADTYWPTYQDGINARWQNTGDFKNDLSPAEKFDAAFHGWNPDSVRDLKPFSAEWGAFDKPFDKAYYEKLGPLAKYCSDFKGNKVTRDASAAGKLNTDGTAKSGKKEEDYGGLETWFGLCHAWTPAAIREKEPLHAVEHNGVRFEVSDIKALLIACYDRSNSIMIGGRNNDRPDKVELDERGRPKKQDYRDINPATFHLLLANLLGRDGQSFAEDRTSHYEVWNQPIAEYRVAEQKEVTAAQAQALLKDTDPNYDYNPQAVRFMHVKTEVDYITESHPSTRPNADNDGQERTDPYEYLLEINAQGEVIGGEWLGTSRNEHPDFLWYPNRDGGAPIAPHIDLEQVRVLLAKSRENAPPQPGNGVNVETAARLSSKQTQVLDVIKVQRDGNLEFMLTGDGDIDVYARKGGAPEFDANSGDPKTTDLFLFEPGSNERKSLAVKAGDEISVVMRGYQDNSTATLRIKQL